MFKVKSKQLRSYLSSMKIGLSLSVHSLIYVNNHYSFISLVAKNSTHLICHIIRRHEIYATCAAALQRFMGMIDAYGYFLSLEKEVFI